MKVYYESSDKKQKIMFDGREYGIADLDLFQHEFKYITENDKITEFTEGIVTRKLDVNITGDKNKSWQQLYDEMNSVFVKDILSNKAGKIYVNDSYMKCFFYASSPSEVFEDWGFQTTELKLVSDRPIWIVEQLVKISAISDTAASEETVVKTYPYTYPYKYPLLQTETSVYVDHYTESDFKLTAYGPTTSVLININGYPYEVEYPLEEGEHMIIDSRPQTPKEERLYVVRANGEKESIFNHRSVENSIFKKIPAGMVKIDYPRTYGVDLIIYKERSEPPWKSSL